MFLYIVCLVVVEFMAVRNANAFSLLFFRFKLSFIYKKLLEKRLNSKTYWKVIQR